MSNINEIIANVEKMDPELAYQLRKYVRDHAYGLVFEHNLPESVRLYTKKAAVGDTVNIRPARGEEEKDENRVPWNVKKVTDGQAIIENGQESKTVAVEDLVPIVSYRDVIYPGLKEVDRIERGGKDDPYQVVINAENYHALEMLTYCYAGKVDCIYIDPPYNSGAKDWKYNNDYVDENDKYRHSKWLAFMERRLKLAKSLLNPKDSVLIVTIDEKEYTRLGLLLEQNFPDAGIQMVSITNNNAGTGRSYEFARVNEYAYFVRIGDAKILPEYEYGAEHKSVLWDVLRRSELANIRPNKKTQFFPIFINDKTGKIQEVGDPIAPDVDIKNIVPPEGCTAVFPIRDDGIETSWSCKKEELISRIEKGYVRVGRKTPKKPQKYSLTYIKTGAIADIENGKAIVEGYNKDGSVRAFYTDKRKKNPPTVLTAGQYDARANGSNLLTAIIGDRFGYPKSLYAVYDCLRFVVANKPNALIIDFFAGSGTTLHAVNLLNASDGGHRCCICVTNNEVSEKEANSFIKENKRQGDTEWEAYGIARYVTWPRTKCSIEGIDVSGNALEGNYGCSVDYYEELEEDVVNPNTGKKLRGKVYKKAERPVYSELAAINKSDGFAANAIFFDLTYESAWPIRLDNAFDAIAPILWMQAGCKGPIIHRVGKSYLTTDYYGVLFDYGQASKFCEKVKHTPSIKTVYVVTDDQRRYSNMCRRLPGIEVHRLYETFLKTFEICGEGGLD